MMRKSLLIGTISVDVPLDWCRKNSDGICPG